MGQNKPQQLILRCYGYKNKQDIWYGVCLELNLAAEADTSRELKTKLNGMIESYINTVLETDDKESIPALMLRRAPLSDWACYHLICLLNYISEIPDRITFDEIIPFRLVPNHC